jgi:hypothetical protein
MDQLTGDARTRACGVLYERYGAGVSRPMALSGMPPAAWLGGVSGPFMSVCLDV